MEYFSACELKNRQYLSTNLYASLSFCECRQCLSNWEVQTCQMAPCQNRWDYGVLLKLVSLWFMHCTSRYGPKHEGHPCMEKVSCSRLQPANRWTGEVALLPLHPNEVTKILQVLGLTWYWWMYLAHVVSGKLKTRLRKGSLHFLLPSKKLHNVTACTNMNWSGEIPWRNTNSGGKSTREGSSPSHAPYLLWELIQ